MTTRATMPDWAKARKATAADPELKTWLQELRDKLLRKLNERDPKLKQLGGDQ
jgi:hypothetical protein